MLTLPISIVLSVLMSGAAFLTVSETTIIFAYLLIGPLLANCFTKRLLGKMPLQWQAQLVDQLSAEMVAPQFAKLPAKLCPKTMALLLYKLAKPLPTDAIFYLIFRLETDFTTLRAQALRFRSADSLAIAKHLGPPRISTFGLAACMLVYELQGYLNGDWICILCGSGCLPVFLYALLPWFANTIALPISLRIWLTMVWVGPAPATFWLSYVSTLPLP